MPKSIYTLLIALLLSLLSACGGSESSDHDAKEPAPIDAVSQPLSGLVEITISGIGSENLEASANVLTPNQPASGESTLKAAAQLTNAPSLEFKRLSTSTIEVGTRGNCGRRYVVGNFLIRNAQSCGGSNCQAGTTDLNNVTLMAISSPITQNGSSIVRLDKFDATPADPSIASEFILAHGMTVLGDKARVGLESFQIFREEELPAPEPTVDYVLPYGFVVNSVNGDSRLLPANPAPGQFDGIVTIAFSFPLQATREEDPFRVSMFFHFSEDGNTRVTQSLEERNPAGDLAALARADTLDTTDIVTLGCDRLPTEMLADTLCRVRLAGPVNAPTAFIVDTDEAAFALQSGLSDEFDGTTLDRNKWCTRFVFGGLTGEEPINAIQPGFEDSFCTRFVMFGGGRGDVVNDEQQRYRDVDPTGMPMHVVSNGTLKLRASETLPTPFANQQAGNFTNLPNNDGTVKHKSAMISSKDSFKPNDPNTVYVIKARLKLPDVQGSFPAMWLYPEINELGGQWPPEIDIMEAALNRVEDINTQISQSVRLISLNGVPPTQTASTQREVTFVNNELVNPYNAGFTGSLPGYETQFSRWIAPSSLRERFVEVGTHWDINGVCFFIDNTKTVCENYQWLTHANQPANPAVLILNLAIGGCFAGRHGIEDANLPTAAEIDWIVSDP